MLNVKQEQFVQNLIKGMSQREAYKAAYNAKYKDEAIDSKASTLFNSDKVQERYKELLNEVKDESIMTAKERMKWLTEVVKGIQKEGVKVKTLENDFIVGEGTADLNTKMRAIDILNKMDGQYTTKLEGSLGITYEEALKKVSGNDEY